jgi:hypothetical protein
MGDGVGAQVTPGVTLRWRALAWVVAVLFMVVGVAVLLFVAMMADWTTDMRGTSDAGENTRFILTGLAVPALGVVLAVGLYRGRRWARVVFYVFAGLVALVAALAVLGAFVD